MEHELINWLDENGKIKGIVDKAIAHTLGLWHRSIHVWVINDKGEVLLQKRCSDKTLYPNHWDCTFAGHVGANEPSELAAMREGEEELGIIVNPGNLEKMATLKEELKFGDIHSKEFVDIYLLHQNISESELSFQVEEVADAKWFNLQDLITGTLTIPIIPHIEEFKLLAQYFNITLNNSCENQT